MPVPDRDREEQTEADPAIAFATYRNYLSALDGSIDLAYRGAGGRHIVLAREQAALPRFLSIRRRDGVDEHAVRGALFAAWHTEAVLAMPSELSNATLVRFTNQWAPVQAYYAMQGLWRAWFIASQDRSPKTHRSTLEQVSEVVARGVLPWPWSATCSGDPSFSRAQLHGFPEEVRTNPSALSGPPGDSSYSDWVAKVLRTTRRFFLGGRETEWKSSNRTKEGNPYRRIPSQERQRIRTSMHPTTIIDLLYRMRLRSNYDDVDDFVLGQLTEDDARTYFRSLVSATRRSMQVVEALVRATMPAGAYDRHANEFLRVPGSDSRTTLAKRLDALAAAS